MILIEGMLWAAENVWALLLHLSGKTSFPQPFTREEESKLLKRLADGDVEARDLLIEHNLRLAAHIAKKYAASGVEMDDLVSIGAIGLIKAVGTFRAEAGKLTAYASRCIENEILMYLRANRKNRAVQSIDDPIGADADGNEVRLIDLLGSDRDLVPEAAELIIETERALKLITRVLDARERRVVILRYGLSDGRTRAQHEVARELGISRSYVSRIEKKALAKLRRALEETPDAP